MEYKRVYYQTLKDRVKQKRKFIQVLTGPRQVGKTTIVRQLCDRIDIPFLYVTADNVMNSSGVWIEQQWETARIKLKTSSEHEFLLIIDEIQKINNWSEIIKQLWDTDTFEKRRLKVVLLGSSGLMLQQGLNESLAGRFEIIEIPHWSFREMKDCFGISEEQYAWFGGYPGTVSFINDEERWKDYVRNALIESTISKDILMLTRISKPALMRQVFEMGVHYSAQILSFNKMLGQLQDAGNTTTIAHYLRILDTAGLITGITKYYTEKYREKTSSPKWQVRNTALISALSEQNFEEVQADYIHWGRIIESAIGAHLVNKSKEGGYKVYYWRHRNEEVDYVLKKADKIIGIEVKSGNAGQTKGMSIFKSKYNPYKVFLVGTSGITWQEFLSLAPQTLFE